MATTAATGWEGLGVDDPIGGLAVMLILLVGVPCLGLGYAIGWKKKLLHLVSGFDDEKARDPDGVARWIGGGTLAIGVLNCAAACVLLAVPNHLVVTLGVSNVIAILIVVIMIVGARRL